MFLNTPHTCASIRAGCCETAAELTAVTWDHEAVSQREHSQESVMDTPFTDRFFKARRYCQFTALAVLNTCARAEHEWCGM